MSLAVLRGELAYLLKMAAEVEGRVSRPRPWWPLLSFPPSSPRDASFPPCHFPNSNGGRTPLRPPSVLTPHSLSPPPLPLGAPRRARARPPGPLSGLMRGNMGRRRRRWPRWGRGSIYFLLEVQKRSRRFFLACSRAREGGGLGVRRSISSGCLHCPFASPAHARARTSEDEERVEITATFLSFLTEVRVRATPHRSSHHLLPPFPSKTAPQLISVG